MRQAQNTIFVLVADANLKGSRVEEEFEHVMGNTPNVLRSSRYMALFDSRCPAPGQEMEL